MDKAKVKITVDMVEQGFNKQIEPDGVLQALSEILDDTVKEIIIKKIPIRKVSGEEKL